MLVDDLKPPDLNVLAQSLNDKIAVLVDRNRAVFEIRLHEEIGERFGFRYCGAGTE